MVRDLAKANGYFSFSAGITRRKNWRAWLREVLRQVPLERLLVETDAP
eukprot:CAMPEP_0167807346 /NCGR_PEP_ID=MMETSP0111_2-20121227/22465_1 /TAXON_ID=91324 /ORGANISM="Lotharella globosa, Strain CCCM811" /LENGTH=47 /DNA_ID= /DNA_START= /DNA_END= /DNA_ORIENTATION=